MKKLKHLIAMLILLGLSTIMNAQGVSKGSGVGEFMRSHQRSYVVVAVMLTILAGLIIYLVRLDRKIRKLEKDN